MQKNKPSLSLFKNLYGKYSGQNAEKSGPILEMLSSGNPEQLAEAFDMAMSCYEEEDLDGALVTFLAIMNYVNEQAHWLASEEILGYSLDCASMTGHILWDKEEMESSKQAFEAGVHMAESAYENLDGMDLDFHDVNDAAVFYIIEDYASILYALGENAAAEKYFTLLNKMDKHNHLGADVALDYLKRGVVWDEYVQYLDNLPEDDNCHCGE